jgi:hypothetical protein
MVNLEVCTIMTAFLKRFVKIGVSMEKITSYFKIRLTHQRMMAIRQKA